MSVSQRSTIVGPPDAESLLLFARICDAGSLSRAAAERQLSRSAASKRLAALERAVGGRLLHRTTRRVKPTELGDALLSHARRIAAELAAAADTLDALTGNPRGTLRVSLPPTLARMFVTPRLPAFLERHPTIELQLLISDLRMDLYGRKVDLSLRVTGEAPRDHVRRELMPITWVALASPGYLARRAMPSDPVELAGHECLVFSHASREAEWGFERDGRACRIRVPGRLRSNTFETLRSLALAGQGIALMPAYAVAEEVTAGTLVPVLRGWRAMLPTASTIYAAYPTPASVSPRLRSFLDFLEDCLEEAAQRAATVEARIGIGCG